MKLTKNSIKSILSIPMTSRAAALSVAVLTALSLVALNVPSVSAQSVTDCTSNSIITCGAQSPSTFISKLRANSPADLQDIYSSFTLTPDKYADFASHAKMGTAYMDGRLVVNGQTVVRDSWSIGREPFSYSTENVINGQTYYQSNTTDVQKSDLPAMVYFNDEGKVQFAVLTACGNPMGGTRVPAGGSCDMLQKTAVSGSDNTYMFTSKATAANGSKVTKVVYDFGDGTSTVTQSNPATPVRHSYANAGTWTAKVTAYISNVGGADVPLTATACQTEVTVTPKPTPTPPTPAPVTPVSTPPTPPPAPVVTPVAAPLPATGPVGVAGVFGGASILGALGYHLRQRRRSQLVDSFVERLRGDK